MTPGIGHLEMDKFKSFAKINELYLMHNIQRLLRFRRSIVSAKVDSAHPF